MLQRILELSFVIFLLRSFPYINIYSLGKDKNPQTSTSNKNYELDTSRKNKEVDGEYIVTWDINLGGKDFLIESPFLKAGLEQSIKDYINNQIQCESDFDLETVSFYSVEILDDPDDKTKNTRGKSGSGKCKGNRTRCKRKVKESISDAGKNASLVNVGIHKNTFCGQLRSRTIFDLFSDVLVTASYFNYNVDVDITNNIGNLELHYNVTFVQARGDGLDQIQDIDLDADDPKEYVTNCTESQCITQNSIMKNIFNHFGIPFDQSKHECLHSGVNCNKDDVVTFIWMGECKAEKLPRKLTSHGVMLT